MAIFCLLNKTALIKDTNKAQKKITEEDVDCCCQYINLAKTIATRLVDAHLWLNSGSLPENRDKSIGKYNKTALDLPEKDLGFITSVPSKLSLLEIQIRVLSRDSQITEFVSALIEEGTVHGSSTLLELAGMAKLLQLCWTQRKLFHSPSYYFYPRLYD